MNHGRRPTVDTDSVMHDRFHESNHSSVMDLDSRDFSVDHGNGKRQPLEQGKIEMGIECVCLNIGETVKDLFGRFPNKMKVLQRLLCPQVIYVIAANLQAEKCAQFFILLYERVLEVGPQYMMALVDPFQNNLEFSFKSSVYPPTENIGYFLGRERK